MTRIAVLSDIHGFISYYAETFPGVNLVILPGDLCSSDNIADQEKELRAMAEKLREMFPDAQDFIIVPGNHDYLLERIHLSGTPKLDFSKLLGHYFNVLVDEQFTFLNLLNGERIRLYGNPRTDLYMAFPHIWNCNDIKRIPPGIDILITHEAPRWYELSCIKDSIGEYGESEPGNYLLYQTVLKIKPKIHVFGHIHRFCEGSNENTTFYNCSQMFGNEFTPNVRIIEYH